MDWKAIIWRIVLGVLKHEKFPSILGDVLQDIQTEAAAGAGPGTVPPSPPA